MSALPICPAPCPELTSVPAAPLAEANPPAPLTLSRWAMINLTVGLSSFGGGSRLLLYRERVVGAGLSAATFDEIVTYSQLMPGPNLVNAVALLGLHLRGVRGCLCGLISLVLPSTVIAVIALVQLSGGGAVVGRLMHGAALSAVGIILAETFGYGRRVLQGAAATHRGGSLAVGLLAAAMATAALLGAPLWALLAAGVALSLWPKVGK